MTSSTHLKVRALLQAMIAVGGLAAVQVIIGRRITRRDVSSELRLNRRLHARRPPALTSIALGASWITDVPRAVGCTAALASSLYLSTGDLRCAVRPAVAVGIGSGMHVAASVLVGRQRPDMDRLGADQPTSSFPSGHVSAATAQAVSVASVAKSLPRGVRHPIWLGAAGYVLAVGWSRLYTGQHFVTDVLAGVVNGVTASAIAAHLVPESSHPGANNPSTPPQTSQSTTASVIG